MNSRFRSRVLTWSAVLASTAALAVPATAGSSAAGRHSSPSGLPALDWSGRAWLPRGPFGGTGPYHTTYNPLPNSVFVDAADHLHLGLTQMNGQWTGCEIETVDTSFGYGSYTFVVETPISAMDPNVVFGMFTRDSLPPDVTGYERPGPGDDPRYTGHAETDLEVGPRIWRKGGTRWPTKFNAQYVVQPWSRAGHTMRINLPTQTTYTLRFVWGPNSTTFSAWRGTAAIGRPVSTWTSHFSNGSPKPGTQVLLDAWLINRRPPARGVPSEIVVDSFTYKPTA
ncbi:MAG: hypothetical protein JO222_04425 [Frankiales bacterium]|nr:hypothetical protein [Frankiales bacterium]